MRSIRNQNCQRGFTLVELLLVLVILALISAVFLPRIIGQAEGAKVKAAATQISRISMAVETYYLDTGNIPDGLDALVAESGNEAGYNGPYIKRALLKDPWSREYQYRNPGDHGDFDIYSFGADGQVGGEGTSADITSWE